VRVTRGVVVPAGSACVCDVPDQAIPVRRVVAEHFGEEFAALFLLFLQDLQPHLMQHGRAFSGAARRRDVAQQLVHGRG
jgi:hypothetical protein